MFIHTSFLGVLKTTIVKDFHNLLFKVDIIKILTTDTRLINMVEKSCIEDHTKADSLKLVSSELAYSKTFNYSEIEFYRNYLYSFITNQTFKEDVQSKCNWNIVFKFNNDLNHFNIVLNTANIQRLFTHVNSFYSNYLILSAMIKFSGNETIKEETKVKSIENEKKITEYINNEPAKTQIVTKIDEERTEIDNIFELSLTTPIKLSLIHYSLNYFQYISKEQCSIQFGVDNPNQILISIPLVVPSNFNLDENYFKSLIVTSPLPTNSIQFVIKKILNNLLTNATKYQTQPLYIMMLSYLLFIYLLRLLYDSNRETFREYFTKLICIATIQKSLFTKLINSTFTEFSGKVFFEIKDIDGVSNNDQTEEIIKISKQYKHLIPISQEDFADKVFFEYKQTEEQIKYPKNFKLTKKKFINIMEYIVDPNNHQFKNIQKKQQSLFFDPENTIDNTMLNKSEYEYSYLDYAIVNNQPKIITVAYQELINYSKNNSSILLLKDNIIPKEVVNLFETLCKKVLCRNVLSKENISTLNYYELLISRINNPLLFRHSTLLYIVFQIMIPFHYDMHNNSQFHDYFL
jgi:hypothetical protein